MRAGDLVLVPIGGKGRNSEWKRLARYERPIDAGMSLVRVFRPGICSWSFTTFGYRDEVIAPAPETHGRVRQVRELERLYGTVAIATLDEDTVISRRLRLTAAPSVIRKGGES